jgi:hypothetical protein
MASHLMVIMSFQIMELFAILQAHKLGAIYNMEILINA